MKSVDHRTPAAHFAVALIAPTSFYVMRTHPNMESWKRNGLLAIALGAIAYDSVHLYRWLRKELS